jgi:hypothetical protein
MLRGGIELTIDAKHVDGLKQAVKAFHVASGGRVFPEIKESL